MSRSFVAAADQGTTGTRFMVFSHDGQAVASSYQEHEQIYPQPGWVEHDPLEIWDKTQRVMQAALKDGGISANDIAAIGVTNQRETTVVWERATGRPVYNAIVWQDTRTRDICQQLIADGLESTVRVRAGLPVATYFSGPKIKWILDHVDGVRARAERGEVLFGNIDTWVIWWLTGGPGGGVHVTDATNASRTMLMDLATLNWDDELLEAMSIPRSMLPAIRLSSDHYGTTRPDGPLGASVPVCGDLGDQQAALVGQTCYSVGEAKNTYGTGCFMLMNTGATAVPSKSGLLTTVAYSLGRGSPSVTYALEGSIAITGAAVQWLRDNLGLIKTASETEEIAQSVEDAGGIYFVPAFSGLFAPYWDMDARGVIVGLTRYVNRAHIVRATLEAICYQSCDVLEAMRADSGIELTALKVDGGAVKNNFLMQLQADILGVPVVRPTVDETTALGAAYAAGLAVGFWDDLEYLRANWGVDRAFEPQWSPDRRQTGYAGWKKAIERTRRWVEE